MHMYRNKAKKISDAAFQMLHVYTLVGFISFLRSLSENVLASGSKSGITYNSSPKYGTAWSPGRAEIAIC